jgi:hypothetical protein
VGSRQSSINKVLTRPNPDRAKAERVCDAMLKLVKLDITALEAATPGK